ncbi:MAG: antitoxin Xre-like helix-turn-helix domain-containing protein [Sulfuricaulis sp.]
MVYKYRMTSTSQLSVPQPSRGPKNLSGPGLRSFFRIMDTWQVEETARVRILGVPRSTYFRWKRDPNDARLSHDTLERLSYVFGIFKAINILLPNNEAADTWVYRPNGHPLFGGQPPIVRLGGGNVADLFVVRQFLDAERGWN